TPLAEERSTVSCVRRRRTDVTISRGAQRTQGPRAYAETQGRKETNPIGSPARSASRREIDLRVRSVLIECREICRECTVELVGAVLRGRGGRPVAPGGVAGANGARGGRPRADARGTGGRRDPGRPVRRRPVVARAREPRLPHDGRGLVR